MVQSKAATPDQYVAELPEEQREVIAAIRKLIRKHLPKGYEETMGYGMLTYVIPLEKYPETYNGEPLGYVALCAQKNYYAIYMLGPYADPGEETKLRAAFKAAGKKLDMGKSCLRFKKLEDLELDAIAKSIASTPPKRYIEQYEAARAKRPKNKRL